VRGHGPTGEPKRTFDYSGDFECRLMPLYTTTTHGTFLTEIQQQTRDWESRERFLVSELTGRCGEFAEYGRVRTFRSTGNSRAMSRSCFGARSIGK
jgi:hypothetical protein